MGITLTAQLILTMESRGQWLHSRLYFVTPAFCDLGQCHVWASAAGSK